MNQNKKKYVSISSLLIKLPKKLKKEFKLKCTKEGKTMSEKIRKYTKEKK